MRKRSVRILLLLLCALLCLPCAARADYESIVISGIPKYGQRLSYTIPASVNPNSVTCDVSDDGGYCDCGICCVCMIEGYYYGYGSDDIEVYHSVIAARNPQIDWANVTEDPGKKASVQPFPLDGYAHSFCLSSEKIHAQLAQGNPVMVHRKYTPGGYEHWVLIYGYDGPSDYVDWRGFLVMSPTATSKRVDSLKITKVISDYSELNCFMYKTGDHPE